MRRTILFAVFAALAVGASAPRAQDAPPVFRSGIDLITVPVRVLDANGRPLEALTATDFAVSIDGRPRTVASVTAVQRMTPAQQASLARSYSTNMLPEAVGTTRTIVLVIDTGGFETAAARGASEQAEKLLDQLPRADLVGFTTVPTPIATIAPTTDRSSVRAALQRVSGATDPFPSSYAITPGEGIRIADGDDAVFEEVARRECLLSPLVRVSRDTDLLCVREVLRDAVRLAQITRDQVRRRLRALFAVVGTLPATPDVKHVVFITPGLVLAPGSEAEYRELGLALTARTAVLSIIQVEGSEGTAESRTMAGSPDWQILSTAMQQMAGITGGDLFRQGTLVTRFERFRRELDAWYVLAVSAERGDLDGKRHDLRIAVPARQVEVQHAPSFARAGRSEPSPASGRQLAEIMRRPGLERAIPLAVQTTTLRGTDPERLQVIAIVRVGSPAGGPGAPPAPMSARVALEVYDGTSIVTAHEGRLERGEAGGWAPSFVAPLLVRPGKFRLRVGVTDATGRAGTVDHPLMVDLPPAGPLRTSGLIIWPTGSAAARPSIDLSTAEPVSAALELYPLDPAASRDADVQFTLSSVADPSLQRAFTGPARQADGGIERVVASLDPAGLPSGEYLIRAEVRAQGKGAVVAQQHIVLHDAPPPPAPLPEAAVAASDAELPSGVPPSVARASAYVDRYFRELTNIVMDEAYEQQLRTPSEYTGSRLDIRKLHSEVLLVTLPPPAGPTAFRDVLTVDGDAVRNRDDRLRRLFMGEQESAVRQARDIAQESSRFNLGAGRTVNAPTVPLLFARADHARRLRWTPHGEQVIAGQRLIRVRFRELQPPTLIRTAEGNDVFAEGELWVHPDDGAIWKVEMAFVVRDRTGRSTAPNFRGEVGVTFRRHDEWGLLVPASMTERYSTPSAQESTGRADYTNFRRFTVVTKEEILP